MKALLAVLLGLSQGSAAERDLTAKRPPLVCAKVFVTLSPKFFAQVYVEYPRRPRPPNGGVPGREMVWMRTPETPDEALSFISYQLRLRQKQNEALEEGTPAPSLIRFEPVFSWETYLMMVRDYFSFPSPNYKFIRENKIGLQNDLLSGSESNRREELLLRTATLRWSLDPNTRVSDLPDLLHLHLGALVRDLVKNWHQSVPSEPEKNSLLRNFRMLAAHDPHAVHGVLRAFTQLVAEEPGVNASNLSGLRPLVRELSLVAVDVLYNQVDSRERLAIRQDLVDLARLISRFQP
jgi:hypothetical protein